jgi:hypothetical protein
VRRTNGRGSELAPYRPANVGIVPTTARVSLRLCVVDLLLMLLGARVPAILNLVCIIVYGGYVEAYCDLGAATLLQLLLFQSRSVKFSLK